MFLFCNLFRIRYISELKQKPKKTTMRYLVTYQDAEENQKTISITAASIDSAINRARHEIDSKLKNYNMLQIEIISVNKFYKGGEIVSNLLHELKEIIRQREISLAKFWLEHNREETFDTVRDKVKESIKQENPGILNLIEILKEG